MPIAFRVASEMANLDSKALHALRNLSQHAEDLVDYLNHMSRKIDLMMSLLLQNQDDPTHQFKTYSFGGGGVTIIAESPMQIGQQAEVKLFLPQEAKAVFCYAEVLTCEAQGAHYKVALVYTSISEDDQELLIRASLHLQTQLLKQRAQHKPA
jgi:c-di-GMP-binding flagellar brake protein YcgR